MHKIYLSLAFLLLALSLQAQKNNFNKQWAEIDTLEVNGKVASALEKTETLLKKAKNNGNPENVLKANIYRWKFNQIIKEGSDLNIIREVNQTFKELTFPYNAVLQAYKAKFLKEYYDQNRWRIDERKPIKNPSGKPLDTWSSEQILSEIREAYSIALSRLTGGQARKGKLTETPVKELSGLLEAAQLNRKYRPTLYDLIANEALDFYESDFSGITRPEAVFAPTAEELLAPSVHFQTLEFKTTDSLYSKLNVVKTYQNLERLHSKDHDPEAFVYTLLQRLDFAKDYFDDDQSWALYLKRMNEQLAAYEGFPVNGLIKYHLAMAYRDRTDEKDQEDKVKFPTYNTKAADLSEEIISEYPETDSAQRAAQLLGVINQVSVAAKMENYSSPNQASLLSVNYKNADSLTLKIAKVPYNFEGNRYGSQKQDSIVSATIKKHSFYTEKVMLPQAEDHNEHSTEFALPPFKIGTYLVYAQTEKQMNNGFTYGIVHMSNLVFSSIEHDRFRCIKILDRENGELIVKVNATFKNNKGTVLDRETSDAEGEINVVKSKKSSNYRNITLIKEGDTLSTRFYGRNYYSNDDADEFRARTMLFLDRAIYRPGQKVYFKGILLKYENKKTEVVVNEFVKLRVMNASGEEIEHFRLKTNQFGSVSGEFTLPKTGLTGNYSIYTEADDRTTMSSFW